MRRLLTLLLAVFVLVAAASTTASADQKRARSAPMLLGVMDDALLGNVPDIAFPAVQQLHPQVIRYDVSWARTAPHKPAVATDPEDPAYDWSMVDQVVLRALALEPADRYPDMSSLAAALGSARGAPSRGARRRVVAVGAAALLGGHRGRADGELVAARPARRGR